MVLTMQGFWLQVLINARRECICEVKTAVKQGLSGPVGCSFTPPEVKALCLAAAASWRAILAFVRVTTEHHDAGGE